MQLQYKSLTLKMFGTLCNRKYNKGGPGQLNSWNATSSKNWKIFHFQDYDNWSPQDAYCEKMRWCNRVVKITLSILFLKHVAGFKFIKIVYITFQEQSVFVLLYFQYWVWALTKVRKNKRHTRAGISSVRLHCFWSCTDAVSVTVFSAETQQNIRLLSSAGTMSKPLH